MIKKYKIGLKSGHVFNELSIRDKTIDVKLTTDCEYITFNDACSEVLIKKSEIEYVREIIEEN